MNRKHIINAVNILFLALAIYLTYGQDARDGILIGIGLFVAAAVNLLFNNQVKD
jgi:hypothetical protein